MSRFFVEAFAAVAFVYYTNDTRIPFNATGCFRLRVQLFAASNSRNHFFLLFLYFAHKSTLWIIEIFQQFEAFKESVESGKRAAQKCSAKLLDLLETIINYVSAFLLDLATLHFQFAPHFFRVVDPSRRVVGVEKLPISSAEFRGVFWKSFLINIQCYFLYWKFFSSQKFSLLQVKMLQFCCLIAWKISPSPLFLACSSDVLEEQFLLKFCGCLGLSISYLRW